MAQKRRKIAKRHGWRRAKRRTVTQKAQFPLEPQIEIPEELACSPGQFFASPEYSSGFLQLLAAAWHQAITEGLTISIGAPQADMLDDLSGHTRGLIIYNIGMDGPKPTRDNVVTLPGNITTTITELLQRRYEHVAFLYLAAHAREVLPLLTDRLVPGSIVILMDDTIVDFCDWAGENNRETYALLRIAHEVVVAMLAN